MKLTDRTVKALALSPGQKDRLVFDDEVRALGLRVTARSKTFIVQWTDKATARKVREPIGVWGSITIEQARAAARAKLGEVARGIDPAAVRQAKKAADAAARAEAALSLDRLIVDWSALHLAKRRPRYAAEAQRALRFAFADRLRRPAVHLKRTDVIATLDEMVKAGKATTASRTKAYGRACYAWAAKRGKVPANPFADLPIATVAVERERILAPSELAEVWAAAGTLPFPFGPFYQLVILTLQRREEVAGMRWSEFAADRTVWTIPAARMKNNRPHDVHLAPAARQILETIPRQANPGTGKPTDLVFTTTGRTPISGYSRAKAQLDAAMSAARAKVAEKAGIEPAPLVPWRLHDIRRTGVSHLAAMGFDSIVADKLLAHKPAKLKGVAFVYQRHDFAAERRKALEAWADYVTGAEVGGNVVRLRIP